MKPLLRTASTLVLAAFALGAFAPAPQAQRDSTFMNEFRQAMKINASDEMERLVKQNQTAAVLAAMETCDLISVTSSDALETEIAALSKAYRAAFDSRFVLKQYEYFSLLSPQFKKTRGELIDRYNKEFDKFSQAREKQDSGKFPAIGLEMYGLGAAFEEIGDLYMASMCYLNYANCFDTPFVGDEADLRRACEGYGFVCEMREKAELKDPIYTQALEMFNKLEFDGYGDPSKGPEARKAARAAADADYAPTPLESSFEIVEEIEDLERPFYATDSIFQAWEKVYLEGIGSQGTIRTMEDRSPTFLRLGASKAMVDVDGDGEGDVEIPLTGKITPVEVTLGQGDEQRKWAFLACIGAQDDTVQGIRPYNLAPSEGQMQIFVGPAASIVGTIAETQVRIIDENMDGLYGGEPRGWGAYGLREGEYEWRCDSIVVGETDRAIPFSKYVKIGDDWYSCEANETQTNVVFAKDTVKTGMIKLDYEGPSVDYLILRGRANNDQVFVDIAAGGSKGVEVPVGGYDLFNGRISKGKKAQTMKAMILPTKNTASWNVTEGGTTTVELGEPFVVDFTMEQDDETLTVIGSSVIVQGRGLETYQRLWNCVPQLEVMLRKAGSKKGSKEAKIHPVVTMDEANELGEIWIWYPVGLPMEKKKLAGEAVEVQLVEKKNKLFGKLESEWKGE